MCFSATASFVASGVLATIGVATLRHVRQPRALLFAAVPLLFAVHQFSEGFVWLGLDGRIPGVAFDHATFLFLIYAEAILPLFMPAAIALMEPPGWRRLAILALTALGAFVFAWNLYGLIFFPSVATMEHHAIVYSNPVTDNMPLSLLYILATCGAMVLSTHRVVRAYGALNIVGLTIVEIVKGYAFASVWCFYAAILSGIIYWQFNRENIDIDKPNSLRPILGAFVLPWLRWPKGAIARR